MEQVKKLRGSNAKKNTTKQEPVDPKQEKAEKLKGDLDDLLDEIDAVLEENAEEFVRNFVQKGGE